MEVKIFNDKTQKSESELREDKQFNIISPTSSNLLNDPLDFSMIQNPLEELAESKSAIIHIKNTCKNSFFNCYVNCCIGHSVIFNTFLKTPKGIKYLFQNNASINPDFYNCTFKDNIKLQARFTSSIKSNPNEILQLNTGNLFAEMLKTEKFCCCDKEEILMPVNIIAENRIAGIVRIHGLPATNCCSNNTCLLLACCWCSLPCFLCLTCCPFCSFECGDCGKSDKESSGCCSCISYNSDKKSGCCNCDCCNSDKKCPCCDENRCCCGLCEKSSCPCCDENRCCCGLCEKSSCPCCDENRCCCGLCEKSKGPCCCCCCCSCDGKANDNNNSGSPDTKCCWDKLSYHCEILSPNKELKYNIYLISHNCGNKCLRRRKGLDFFITDANNNQVMNSFINGRNNKNFGTFFDDSYSYEINFPEDAEPDYKLTLLHAIYALDALCIY